MNDAPADPIFGTATPDVNPPSENKPGGTAKPKKTGTRGRPKAAAKKAETLPAGEPIDSHAGIRALSEPGGVTRRKMNRGSTRRIMRALEGFSEALKTFRDEIDRQVYVTDEEGGRVREAPLVMYLDDMSEHVNAEVARYTAPPVD